MSCVHVFRAAFGRALAEGFHPPHPPNCYLFYINRERIRRTFLGVTIIALLKHGLHFFSFFVPAGAPKVLIPFLIVIEVISYFVRPVSLSVRLFANMLAGHTMLKVFAGLAVMISGAGGLAMAGSLLPFLALIGLTGLEVLVAALQAYVFTILTCMYLNDALHLH